ncbi:MAG TPA: anti-sigma factor [Pyrinomonadaceae bacterium]|nr:anti-sigma factor [Pyrinomonadaceae bacterium]
MVHKDYKEMIPARAVSALDAEDARVLNEHLENCPECRTELEDWETTAAALALAAEPLEPSPKVRERILSEIRSDGSTSRVIPFKSTSRNIWTLFGSLGAIAAVVLFVVLIVGLIVLWRQNRAAQSDLARANEFLQLVTTPGAKVTELKGTNVSADATAKLVYDRSGRAILIADRLPSAPQGKAYQLWFIVGNKPLPGKTFVPDNSGKGVMKDQVPATALDSAVFAITLEAAGGATAPTGSIYLSSGQ